MEVVIKNLKVFGEHNGNTYLVYFEDIPKEKLCFSFNKRWAMEEFIYKHGIEKFDYKSSNGKTITKVWKYIPEKLKEWKEYDYRTKWQIEKGMPEKYSYSDLECGHFVKE